MEYTYVKDTNNSEVITSENKKELGDIRVIMDSIMFVWMIDRRIFKDQVYWRKYGKDSNGRERS